MRGARDADRAPGAATLEGATVPARRANTPSHRSRSVWVGAGLVPAARVRRSRHFAGLVAVGGIMLVGLTQIGWKVLGRVARDLIAWDNARAADVESQLRRQRMARPPDGAILEGSVIPPPQPGASSRQYAAVWLGVGLVAAARALRNHRLDEQAVAVIFALAALSQMSWKELVRAVRDLIAWDNARLADLNRQLRRDHEAKTGQSAAS